MHRAAEISRAASRLGRRGTGSRRRSALRAAGRRKRTLAGAAALVAVVMSLAACSSSDGSGGSGNSASAMSQVSYAEAAANLTDANLVVAQREGYFTRNHVKVNIVSVTGGTTALAALTSGSIDLGGTTSLVMLLSADQKVGLVSVADTETGVSFQLVVSKKVWEQRHLSYTTSVATMAKDIKGLTIGNMAPGATGTLYLNGLVDSVGHDSTSWFTHNSVKQSAEQLAALQHGEIDATFTAVPTPEEAVSAGYGEILFQANSVPAIKHMLYGVIVAKKSWADAHATAVRRFNAAIAEAQTFIDQHTAQAAQMVKPSEAPTQPVSLIETELKDIGSTQSMVFPAGAWASLAEVATKYHLESFTVTPAIYNAAYTNKFAG